MRNKVRVSIPVSALAAALCLSTAGVNAAGLGKITVLSPLGQPLRAELDVTASREELPSMAARLASAEAFKQAGIEYVPSMTGIRFAIDKRKDGRPFLRVTTDRPVNDPFLDILVELTWSSGRLVREYTMLLDPPEALTKAAPAFVAPPEIPRTTATESAPPPVAVPVPVAAPTSSAENAPTAPVAVMSKQPAVSERERPTPEKTEKSVEAGGDTRVVKSGETLVRIATESKPEGANLDQMLVALLRRNQESFGGGNINRLRAGTILKLPDAESVTAIAPGEARKIVVAQASDFNAYRSKLAAAVAAAPAAREDSAKQTAEGRVSPQVVEKPVAPAPVQDKLAVSRTEAAKETKALQGRITSLEEDLVARDRALKEASSRVAELERNLADLRKLAELKSQAGAQLEQQAQSAVNKAAPETKMPEPAPAAAPVPAVPVATLPKPDAAPSTESGTAANPVVEATPPEKPADTPPAVEQAVKPVTPEADKPNKPVVTAPPPPVAETSFIDENPALIYGGGGLLALLLGYFVWRRKRQGADATGSPSTSRLSEGDLMANSVFGSTGGQAVDTGASIQTDFSQANLTAIDADEGVDPVAEADVYMAYGRDAQAEEILVDALKNDPTRHAIHLKLLEIYSGRKNPKQFEVVARELYGQTGGVGSDWERAAVMGQAVDPGNALYAAVGAVGPVTSPTPDELPMSSLAPNTPPISISTPPVSPEFSASTLVATPGELQKMQDTVTLPGHFAQLATAVDAAATAARPLDLELNKTMPSGILSSATGQPTQTATELDFDLDLDLPSTTTASAAAESIDLGVDLSAPVNDRNIPPASSMSATSSTVSADADLPGGLDFEFDLDTPGSSGRSSSDIDLTAIDLDLDAPLAETSLNNVAASLRQIDRPGNDGDSDNPDVTTKLELAQAYEEMGDKEGARELLQEVLNEGGRTQQELARAKLATLDA